MTSPEEMLSFFADVPEAVHNTQRIAEQLGIRATKYTPSAALAHLWS